MKPLSQTIPEQYQIRKTKKHKSAFILFMQETFPELTVHRSGFPMRQHIMIGNPDQAQIVLAAHYDTGVQRLIHGFITPRNLLTAGTMLGRKHCSNDNTVGVIALYQLAQTLDDAQREKVAFLFYDGKVPFEKNYLVIDLDCAPTGNHILVAASKSARENYGKLLKRCFQPTESKSIIFANAEKTRIPGHGKRNRNFVTIATLEHKKCLGYYADRHHTSRDAAFDKANVKLLCDSILNLLKQL